MGRALPFAKFVKVLAATGCGLPAEVLRADMHRDVALLKTARKPFDPLPMRVGEAHYVPQVG